MQIRTRSGYFILFAIFISINIFMIYKGPEFSPLKLISIYGKVPQYLWSLIQISVSIFRVRTWVLYWRARRRRWGRWRGGAGQRIRSTSPSRTWSGTTRLCSGMRLTSKMTERIEDSDSKLNQYTLTRNYGFFYPTIQQTIVNRFMLL